MERTHIIIVAAGSSKRFGGDIPKQYIKIDGNTILEHNIDTFAKYTQNVHIVINPEHKKHYEQIAPSPRPYPLKGGGEEKMLHFINGGATRQESVFLGLKAIEKYNPEKVLIHDAARPFVKVDLVKRIIKALDEHKAVLPVVRETNTVKLINDEGFVEKTLDREKIGLAQTPQGFWFDEIFSAHKKTTGQNFTDDAGIAEFCGIPVFTVEGEKDNYKITYNNFEF